MAGSSVSSVEGTRAGSYEGEDVQAAAPQPAEVGIAAAEAIRIWDYLIGSNLGRRALRVVLASNWEMHGCPGFRTPGPESGRHGGLVIAQSH